MKKTINFSMTPVNCLITLFAIVVFFQSCCFCKQAVSSVQSNSPRIANNSPTNSATVKQAIVHQANISDAAALPESETNDESSFLKTDMPLALNREVKIEIELPIVQTEKITHAEQLLTDKNALALNNIKNPITGKRFKPPFGIQSISTYFFAGPNISFKSSNENTNHKPRIGFEAGLGFDLGFNEKWSVSPAFGIKQNNASENLRINDGNFSAETTDKYSYTYLSAPVLAEYAFNKNISAFAGPELNYLLNANVKSGQGNGKTNITKSSVKLGLGIQAGVKYTIPSNDGKPVWGVKLLYDHRISRLNKKTIDGYGGGYNVPGWHIYGLMLSMFLDFCSIFCD